MIVQILINGNCWIFFIINIKNSYTKLQINFMPAQKKAGLWMFPESIVESDKFKVIHNAVDTKEVCL